MDVALLPNRTVEDALIPGSGLMARYDRAGSDAGRLQELYPQASIAYLKLARCTLLLRNPASWAAMISEAGQVGRSPACARGSHFNHERRLQ